MYTLSHFFQCTLAFFYNIITSSWLYDDVIKWKYFPRYWPFVQGIHRSLVNSPHRGQWRGALMFSLICAWIKGWVNHREAGDLIHHRVHYDVIVMWYGRICQPANTGLMSWYYLPLALIVDRTWGKYRPTPPVPIWTHWTNMAINNQTSNGSWCIGIKG